MPRKRKRKRKMPALAEHRDARLLGLLGLATRAGKLRIGMDAVERSIRQGEARAIVIAGDASERIDRVLGRHLRSQALCRKVVVEGDRLGRALGRDRVAVVAVTDAVLAERVLTLADALSAR